MIKDRAAFDLPAYDGLLAGHYQRGPGYGRRRPGGTDDWLLIMTLKGKGRFGGARGDLVVEAPQLVLIAPGTTHDYGIHKLAQEWEILWVHFHPAEGWLEWLDWPESSTGLRELDPPRPDLIEEAFREVLRLSLENGPYRRQLAMNSLERLLLICACQRPSIGRTMDERIRRVLAVIHQDLSLVHAAEDLGSLVGLSPSRLSHLFKEEVGLSPRQYLLQQRILRSQRLLEKTSLGVAEIAHAVGMDPAAFTLRFKAEIGQAPREYRRSVRTISLTPLSQGESATLGRNGA